MAATPAFAVVNINYALVGSAGNAIDAATDFLYGTARWIINVFLSSTNHSISSPFSICAASANEAGKFT